MNKLIIGFCFLFPLLLSAQSNYKNIIIDEAPAAGGPEEPTIAISLKDTNKLVAGANINRSYYSLDGGRTWTKQRLNSKFGVWGDPVTISNDKGHFFFFHLSDPTGKNWQSEEILDRIVVQRSKSNGKRWNKGQSIGLNHPKDQDKEWACFDPISRDIVVTWTQFDTYGSNQQQDSSYILFSRSNPRGKKWTEPIRINQYAGDCVDDDQTTEGAVPAFGPDGEIYVAWSYNNQIWFDYSTDGGSTWQDKDVVVSDQPGGWTIDIPGVNRCNGMPVTVCDLSPSKYNGTVYVNWADQRNGETDTDIFVAKSTDGGQTWSNPIQVNDDQTVAHQFLTWMAIDQTNGNLYCVFYDRRNYLDNQTDVYLATSSDGGETWINERISEAPFTPTSEVFFGDYNNISAHKGMVRPIWTHLENGKLSIRTAIIQK